MLLGQLPERRGVEVQPLDADQRLVVVELRGSVQPPCGLGQHARRLNHPVQPDGRASSAGQANLLRVEWLMPGKYPADNCLRYMFSVSCGEHKFAPRRS